MIVYLGCLFEILCAAKKRAKRVYWSFCSSAKQCTLNHNAIKKSPQQQKESNFLTQKFGSSKCFACILLHSPEGRTTKIAVEFREECVPGVWETQQLCASTDWYEDFCTFFGESMRGNLIEKSTRWILSLCHKFTFDFSLKISFILFEWNLWKWSHLKFELII